jgi:hypothetical protein
VGVGTGLACTRVGAGAGAGLGVGVAEALETGAGGAFATGGGLYGIWAGVGAGTGARLRGCGADRVDVPALRLAPGMGTIMRLFGGEVGSGSRVWDGRPPLTAEFAFPMPAGAIGRAAGGNIRSGMVKDGPRPSSTLLSTVTALLSAACAGVPRPKPATPTITQQATMARCRRGDGTANRCCV